MNEVHLTGLVQTVWEYEGDTFLRIHMDRHRHSLGGRRQDRIAVRVPPHVGSRTPLETGRHLAFHGYLESEANGTVEEDLRRRLRRGGRRGPDAVERLIDDTPATIRRLTVREELRLVAERIEELPNPRRNRGSNRRNNRANGRQANTNQRQATPGPAAAPAPDRTPEPRSHGGTGGSSGTPVRAPGRSSLGDVVHRSKPNPPVRGRPSEPGNRSPHRDPESAA